MCRPRDEGGLGLRDLSVWNKAMLSKTLWNIHSKKESLWIRWVHSEYLRGEDIWNIVKNPRISPFLKNILDIRGDLVSKCAGDISKAKDLLASWFENKGPSAAYHYMRTQGEKHFWHKKIWKEFIPTKFSTCLWLALQDRLKTANNLPYMDIARTCPVCNTCMESNKHLFFECNRTRIIWNHIRHWLRIERHMSSIAMAVKWLSKELHGSGIVWKARWVALAATVSHIWYARNFLVFDSRPFYIPGVVKAIKSDVYRVIYSMFPVEAVVSHLGA